MPQLISFLTGKDYYVRFVTLVNINRGSPTVPPELAKAAMPLLDDIEFLKYLNKFYEEADREAGARPISYNGLELATKREY